MDIIFNCGHNLYIDNVHTGSIPDDKHAKKLYCPICCKKEKYEIVKKVQ